MFARNLFLAISCVIIASASAFAPSNNQGILSTKTDLSCATTKEIQRLSERSEAVPYLLRPQNCKGYVGDVGFDPFQFSDNFSMEYLREAELKHGRVCMLAWSGWVAVDMGLRVYPAPEGWVDLTSFSAHNALVTVDPSDPQGFWASPLALLLYAITIPELYACKAVNQMLTEGKSEIRAAGDLGWDVLGFLTDKSEEDVNRMKLRELKHARLGMLAFSGVVTQSALDIAGSENFPYFP